MAEQNLSPFIWNVADLPPLVRFGREREGIDLSKVVLTHHTVKSRDKAVMPLGGETPKLEPISEAGAGQVQEPTQACLQEIIEQVNDLFQGELTDPDKLVYVNNVIKGKLLESKMLKTQAANNSKEQFGASPDVDRGIDSAIIDAMDAHTEMSRQALNSPEVRRRIKEILLQHAGLYEALRNS